MYQNPNGYNTYQQPAPTPAPTPQHQQAADISLDSIMQGGTPSAFTRNDPIGTSVTGEITEIRAEQQTDFTTGEPLFYPNGKPKPQVVIHVRTSQRDPNRAGDDGLRAIYVKGYNIAPLRLASQQAGVGDYPRVGDTLTATFSSTRPASQRGYNDAKIYTYQVTPGTPGRQALNAAMNDPQATAAPMPHTPAGMQPQTAPQVDERKILQLRAMGKNVPEVQALTGYPAAVINRVYDQANANTGVDGSEPEF